MPFRSMRPVAPAALMLALALLAVPDARATCGASQCFLEPVHRSGYGRGEVHFDLSFQYVNQSRKLAGDDRVGEVLVPEVSFEEGELELDHHKEERTQNTLLHLDLTFGVTGRLAVFTVLPLFNERDHEHFVLEQDPVTGEDDFEFTGEDGTTGFGDVRIGVRARLLARPRDTLEGELGIELPTGSHRTLDSEGTINEPSIQPGSGSYDGVAGLSYTRAVKPERWDWFVSASHQLNTENDLDYELGDVMVVNTGFRHRLKPRVEWSLQLNGRHAGRDEFLGEKVPSTGSDYLNLTPGVRLTSPGGTSFYGFLQVPVYQDVNEEQIAPQIGLLLGVSRSF